MNKKTPFPSIAMCAAIAIVGVSRALAQPAQCDIEPTFASNPAAIDHGYFGSDIALDGDGDLAIVGEFSGHFNGVDDSGTARIFGRPAGQWQEAQTIQQTGPQSGDRFGASVDISGDKAIIAAPGRSDFDGAVFFFLRAAIPPFQWSQQQELTNPGPPGDGFGGSQTQHETVAIDRNFAVASASEANVGLNVDAGRVYTYSYNSSWVQGQQLTAPTTQAYERFGYSVDISGTRIIVGAPFFDSAPCPGNGCDSGRVIIFRRDMQGAWVHEATINNPSSLENDHFGWSVSIDGNNVIVGAPGKFNDGIDDTGFASVFKLVGSVWVQDGTDLVPPNTQEDQSFGYSVNISGTMALVGAPNYNIGSITVGTAYLYQRLPEDWVETVQLYSNQGALGDRVGETLALDGDEVFIGAQGDQHPTITGDSHGSILVFPDLPACSY